MEINEHQRWESAAWAEPQNFKLPPPQDSTYLDVAVTWQLLIALTAHVIVVVSDI